MHMAEMYMRPNNIVKNLRLLFEQCIQMSHHATTGYIWFLFHIDPGYSLPHPLINAICTYNAYLSIRK